MGWWTDETKGYRLEDLENHKVITLQDVHFLEDSLPSELVVMDLQAPVISVKAVNDLIDGTIEEDIYLKPAHVVKRPTRLSHFLFLFFSFLLVTSQKRGKGCHTCVTSYIR